MHNLLCLKKGDIIDIIAPGSGSTDEDTQKAVQFLENLGLTPRVPNNILGTEPYHSHTDEIRFHHLNDALNAEDSKAIWCLRGGYGTARLMPMLHKISQPTTPKWIIGFSDVTALHLYIAKYWQWPTLHAAVLFQAGTQKIAPESIDQTLALLRGELKTLTYKLTPLNNSANAERTIESTVIGGNLSLVQTSIGTLWQLDASEKILFLEDAFERGYSIDRKLTHLAQAGLLDQVEAIILGDMQGDNGTDADQYVEYAIERFVTKQNIPIAQAHGIGHRKTNTPLPFGISSTLTLGKSPQLICHLENI